MSLRIALLSMLDISAGSGYSLYKRFQKSVGFFWHASHQQLYKELHQLETDGFVNSKEVLQQGKPNKRVYTISKDGENELERLLVKPADLSSLKKDFMTLKVFSGNRMNKESLINEIKAHLQLHQEKLARYELVLLRYNELTPKDQEHLYYPTLSLRLGIKAEQAWISWAEEALDELEK